MRWDQEPAAKSPLCLQHGEVTSAVAPHACLRHPYHLLHSQEVFGTSQGLPGRGITYRRAKSSFEAKCWPFPKGPGAFADQNPPQRLTWNVQHLSESGREESKAWWEPRFGHLLPGRGWRLRDAGGLSTATEPASARVGMMLPLRQLAEIWPCTLKQETPLCRKVWDGTNRVGGYRLHSSGLSLPLSQYKTLATFSPESLERLLCCSHRTVFLHGAPCLELESSQGPELTDFHSNVVWTGVGYVQSLLLLKSSRGLSCSLSK